MLIDLEKLHDAWRESADMYEELSGEAPDLLELGARVGPPTIEEAAQALREAYVRAFGGNPATLTIEVRPATDESSTVRRVLAHVRQAANHAAHTAADKHPGGEHAWLEFASRLAK